MALLCSWLVLGLYIDGWAHRHFKIETFFTPWHLILYAGFVAVASYLLLTWHRNHTQGYPWQRALPAGYELSLLGLLIFVRCVRRHDRWRVGGSLLGTVE